MNHRAPITALTAALLAASLAGCSSATSPQPKAASKAAASKATPSPSPSAKKTVDCSDQSLSQADWIKYCGDAAGTKAPADLAVGKPYRFPDGVQVTVTAIKAITKYGEYDIKPDANQYGFRIYIKVSNGTSAPIDLDNISDDTVGATDGGETEVLGVDTGSAEMTGRLAPGVTTTKTAEYALKKSHGRKVAVTIMRVDMGFDTDTSPTWTGEIQ